MLTFLSEAEVESQVRMLCKKLGVDSMSDAKAITILQFPSLITQIIDSCTAIIQQEGGESKSDRAKQASALKLLVQG